MGEPVGKGKMSVVRMDDHLRSIDALGPDYWWHDHRHRLVHAALPAALPRSVLDFGCGSGAFLHWLAARENPATKLFGYDVSHATQVLIHAPRGRITLLPSWPPPAEARFDAVVAMDVLEHVADDVACLRSLTGALAPGGRLIVTVPAHRLFWSSWDVRLGHYRRYDGKMLREALTSAGLTVERLTHVFSFLTLPALVRRLLPAKAADAPAEFAPLPKPVHMALHALCAAERRVLSTVGLPLGTSLLAVAHHRDEESRRD